MADFVLSVGGELCDGAVEFGQVEERIVPEAVIAARFVGDSTLQRSGCFD